MSITGFQRKRREIYEKELQNQAKQEARKGGTHMVNATKDGTSILVTFEQFKAEFEPLGYTVLSNSKRKTLKELRSIAKEKCITDFAKMTEKQLIESLSDLENKSKADNKADTLESGEPDADTSGTCNDAIQT